MGQECVHKAMDPAKGLWCPSGFIIVLKVRNFHCLPSPLDLKALALGPFPF